jgi:hypothetical protein
VPIKSWTCPGCHRAFIVDAETSRDTCPWCQAVVEQSGDNLKVTSEAPKPAGQVSGSGEANPSGSTGTQAWWPFEYSS